MTITEKKQVLKDYRIHDRKLDEIKELYERRKSQIISPSANRISDMPGCSSYNKNKIPDAISMIQQLEERLIGEQMLIVEHVWKVDEAISKLESAQATVLHLRYRKRYRWDKIALEMNIDKRTAQRTHGRALQKLEI